MKKFLRMFVLCTTVTFFNVTATSAPVEVATQAEETERQWVEVNLETPGSLGVEILYKVDKLADVKHLRVSGTLNDDDWVTLKNLTSIQSLDLSNASATTIPAEQFKERSSLTEILLPKDITTINREAFRFTSLKTITFPASLKSIGSHPFANITSLESVNFDSACQVTNIPEGMCYDCTNLKSVSLSDKIVTIKSDAFRDCKKLENIKLPSNLQTIGGSAFNHTESLKLIDFPSTLQSIEAWAFDSSGLTAIILPVGVQNLGDYCFTACRSATELVLPGKIHHLSGGGQFTRCDSLKSITCLCAVPPVVTTGNIGGFKVEQATLHVPDFALVNYKLDSFWLRFGTIVGDATSDYWSVSGELAMNNNRRWEGTPSVDINSDGHFTVGGDAAMVTDNFNIHADIKSTWPTERAYGQVICNSPSVTANRIALSPYVGENNWYFLTVPFNVNVADVTSSDKSASFVFRYYDGAQRAASGEGNNWKNVPADGVLEAGKGYIFQTDKRANITLPAAEGGDAQLFDPNARIISLDANASSDAANAGWNYLGNPYPSHYDMYYTMLTSPVIVWNRYDRRYDAYSIIDDDLILEPWQAFFIQANDNLTSIEFGTKGRQFNTTVSRPQQLPALQSTDVATRHLFNLVLNNEEQSDKTRIVLNEEASEQYEAGRDAAKFFSDDTSVVQFYTVGGENECMAINERPEADGIVRLGFYASKPGKMSISASRLDGTVILHDALTNTSTELSTSESYLFEVKEAGHNDTRFTLTLKASSQTGIAAVSSASTVVINVSGNSIAVKGCADSGVEIITVDGRLVARQDKGSDTFTYTAAPGIYIIKAGEKISKCVIR